MPLSQNDINGYIAKAQARMAELGYEISVAEKYGEDPDCKYNELNYLSGAVKSLTGNNDLTNNEIRKVVDCMIKVGDLDNYANSPFTFKPLTIVKGLQSQNLQTVTDVGNITTNAMYVDAFGSQSVIDNTIVYSFNQSANTYTYIDANGQVGINTNGNYEGIFKTSNITDNINLEFPNKPGGTYTIATIDDVTALDLQAVTDVGNTTNHPIVAAGVYAAVVACVGVNDSISMDYTGVYAYNYNNFTGVSLLPNGTVSLNNGVTLSSLKNTNVTIGNNVTLEFPDKATGSYTIATTADLGIIDLQTVTDNGNITNNDIEFSIGAGILLDNGSRLRKGTIDANLGGAKGIAQICAVGYELKWEAGRLYVMDGNGLLIRESRYNFTNTPTVTDDDTQGYYVGSRWLLDNGDLYICNDSTTGAAVWALESNGVPTLQQVTDSGSSTSNNIVITDGLTETGLEISDVYTTNLTSNAYAYLSSNGVVGINSTGTSGYEGAFQTTNVTANVILEFPNKAAGSYTIATTADIISGGITGQGILTAIPRVLTIDGSNNIVTVESSDFTDSTYITYLNKDGDSTIDTMGLSFFTGDTFNSKGVTIATQVDSAQVVGYIQASDNIYVGQVTVKPTDIGIVSPNISVGTLAQFVTDGGSGTYIQSLSDGTSGDYLTTDGAGNYSWVAASVPTLQAVVTAGQIVTDKTVEFQETNFSGIINRTTIQGGLISVINPGTSNTATSIEPYSLRIGNNNQIVDAGILKATNVSATRNVTLEFPDKPTGSYTIATTADITSGIPHATASGIDTYTATITGVTSYADGDAYLIRFGTGNTTAATLDINSLGAVNLYRNNDGALIGGDIWDGGEMLCIYNSTLGGFQCIGTAPNSLFAYVTNADIGPMTKGQAVYAFGATGNRMTVKRANNTSDATSAKTVGIVFSSSILSGQKGIIIIQGMLEGLSILPTSTWADGDTVYLGSTSGSITPTKQYAPNHLVYLGIVTTASNGSSGRMYVRIQNGYEMDELHNVSAQSPSLNDGLFYNTSTSLWETKSIATVLGYTPQAQLTSGTNIKTVGGISLLGSGDLGIITGTYGGTGVNNGSKTITLGGNLTTTGAFNTTFSVPATATYTLPSATSTLLANNLGITGGSTWISGTAAADKAIIQSTSNATHTAGKNLFKFKKNGSADSTTSVAFSIGDGDNGVSNDRVQFWALNNSAANDFFLHVGASFTVVNATTDLRLNVANTAMLLANSSGITMLNGMTVTGGKDITFGTASGTKIGSGTNQLLSFWNKTPISQPGVGIAGATRVGGAGTTVTTTDTYGGYTIAQIAQALINVGLLA